MNETATRSLQLRVVTITLVTSSLLVGGFAYLIADKITSILLENAEISHAILRVLAGRVRRYLQLELKALAGDAPVVEPAL